MYILRPIKASRKPVCTSSIIHYEFISIRNITNISGSNLKWNNIIGSAIIYL